ncbi:transcription initiation factor TFIID subunit 1 [Chironomus tepperi]|uniref:transcription initiation factor TFIID subunit 1 n=1 Tax=Chironomus tepperi TaxID=113505 RepID=UPI00391EF9DA
MSNIDSDEEHEDDALNKQLAGFLFGNIDENGKLESDFLDEDVKKHVGSLSKFGLHNIISSGFITDDEASDSDSFDSSDSGGARRMKKRRPIASPTDYNQKKETAEDFFDIDELAEEGPEKIESKDDYDIEDAIPAAKVSADFAKDSKIKIEKNDDKDLMPPPPLDAAPSVKLDESSTTDGNDSSDGNESRKSEKKLDTPLAAMLPSKYQNINVTELFPDFRQDKVLRFSRLFGPGKFSSLPQIWRSVRRRVKKRKKERERVNPNSAESNTSDSDLDSKKCNGFNLKFAPVPPKEQIVSDDEEKLLSEKTNDEKEEKNDENGSNDQKAKTAADWRFGPAQIWYDMLDVPETGEGFNYGFKLKDRTKCTDDSEDNQSDPDFPHDAYLMVSQLHWEDDVVWDGTLIKDKVEQKLNSKTNAAGWLPSSGSRTAGAFSQPGKSNLPGTMGGKDTKATLPILSKYSKSQPAKQQEEHDDTWYSIFPVENEELVYSKWEDEVIWDAEAVDKVPKPKVLTLDPNDENIILGIPDDIDPSKIQQNTGNQPKVKIPHPHVKKSKILLGKAGVINVLAEDTPPPPPKSPDRDPFNISNDVYYAPKTFSMMDVKLNTAGSLLQHSTPVVELRSPFIPTHMGPMKLRMFHRPHMKNYSHGVLASTNYHPVAPLQKHINKKAQQREAERVASGGGDIFFMRTPEDLTGRDGEIIMIEFCEEHPPLLSQVGMCSKLKNYYKRDADKPKAPSGFKYGETVPVPHPSPFLGILNPGQHISVIENNMFRAPIYEHQIPVSDFLIIRTRNNYYVREADGLFTAGQECPLYEVPGPNSKRANNFVRDFLQVFIYRLFWKSRDNPRKIRMDDIKSAFPAHSESSIRKRLKQCADFKRTGMDSNFWVIKPDFRLPSEEEIRAMVSPEQCCAYFSMISAEQRLKDAGYGEKFIFAQQEDDDEEMQLKMDDEVKVAPWNTTRAYLQAMRGRCILQLNGPADPTGCGEGFSYVRMPNKPTQNKEEQESQPKRTVTGTDADLRRLPLSNAKALLRKYNVPEEEIKKLSRWEVIDVVRTLSTEKAKAGEEGMDKFSRGNRFSIAEHQERYKEECQRIFNLQNRVLASSEVLSTDDEESEISEESDLEEMGKNLENMLVNKKTSSQVIKEREEMERQELLKLIESNPKAHSKKKDDELNQSQSTHVTRILKITRTFRNSEGREYTRIETVRRSAVIDAYEKIRKTKDDEFIKRFASMDEAQKEEMKRERRRLQEQLRRIKRNQEKINAQAHDTSAVLSSDRIAHSGSSSRDPSVSKESPLKKKVKLKPDLKLKCGACGAVGHMRTNKACPKYTGILPPVSPVQVAMTEEQEEEIEKELNVEDEDLVNVDGTKVKLSSKLLKRHEDVKRRALLLKVPRDAMGKVKRRRMGLPDEYCDYLQYNKTAHRARTDPIVVLCSILEEILSDLRDLPDMQPFMFPVNAKKVPDYYKIIQNPMDLTTMRDKLRQRKYITREEFLADINLIVDNSALYNGPTNTITMAAKRLLQKCIDRIAEKEEKLMYLEKAINPLLGDDDQASLSFIFEQFMNTKLKIRQESFPFMKPVNKKTIKGYYDIIKNPMDLETMTKKIAAHRYHSRNDFLNDLHLIASNSEKFNGEDSKLTKEAKVLVDFAKSSLEGLDIGHLEANIAQVQERAKQLEFNWGDDEESFGNFPSRRASKDGEDGDDTSRPGPSIIPPQQTEVKRSRGRPRKNPGAATSKYVKKDKTKPVEEVIDVVGDFGPSKSDSFSIDNENFGVAFDAMPPMLMQQPQQSQPPQPLDENDSQQAAEAMIQLGYYSGQQQQDESMDFDPNYDPSDFLLSKNPSEQEPIPQAQQQSFQQDAFMYSGGVPVQEGAGGDDLTLQQNFYGAYGQQAFNVGDYSFQSQSIQEEYSQSQPIISDGGGLADLEISDSDDDENEENNTSENQADTSKDEDGLWF